MKTALILNLREYSKLFSIIAVILSNDILAVVGVVLAPAPSCYAKFMFCRCHICDAASLSTLA